MTSLPGGRVSKSKEMRRLADDIAGRMRLCPPTTREELFAALVAAVAEIRGRRVVLCEEVFPPHTASGLWLELKTHDIIVVEKRAAPMHQLVIFFHEVWHMLKGDCGLHVGGAAVASRLLTGDDDPRQAAAAAVSIAARTDFSLHTEQEAERFGLFMGRRLRSWLHGSPCSGPGHSAGHDDGIAGRIGTALGYRGPRI